MANYKDLDAWKVSMQLVKEVYLLTQKFPKEELYGLTSQVKKSGCIGSGKYSRRNGKTV